MILYKTIKWSHEIEKVEVTRTTDQMVFYKDSRGKERKESKRSETHKYHETEQAARDFLIHRYEWRIRLAQKEIDDAEEILKKLKK